jgi:pantothenate kinase
MPARPGAHEVAAALLPHVRRRAAGRRRLLLGLAGPPGVGKSKLAAALTAAYDGAEGAEGAAVVVGMDGFHLRQERLERLGLAHVKGAPETFDADAFVALLRRLRDADRPVAVPVFDRAAEEPVDRAVTVAPAHRLVLVEGNYLLLDGPWAPVREVLDEVWHLHLPDDVRVPGLVARHVAHGRAPEAAREWVRRSDEANARLVAAAAGRADAVVDLLTGRLAPARA